jgi:N6-adenosine-specific RNA methylase IME4
MAGWGFEYKVSAVWVKTKADGNPCTGLGFVFRNAHELLLYGTRGNMPGPQYNPPSVFFYQRGEHSAKPPEIRKEIEKMFPDFDETTRLELFARDKIVGWTTYGFEACEPASKIAPEEPVKIAEPSKRIRVHIPLIHYNSEPAPVDRIAQRHLQRQAERANKEAGIG